MEMGKPMDQGAPPDADQASEGSEAQDPHALVASIPANLKKIQEMLQEEGVAPEEIAKLDDVLKIYTAALSEIMKSVNGGGQPADGAGQADAVGGPGGVPLR